MKGGGGEGDGDVVSGMVHDESLCGHERRKANIQFYIDTNVLIGKATMYAEHKTLEFKPAVTLPQYTF